MNANDLCLARRFKIVGNDGVHFKWCTPSWTRAGKEHEVWLEWDTGKFTCSCEHADWKKPENKLYAYLLNDDLSHACKHIRVVWMMVDSYLKHQAAQELIERKKEHGRE